MKCSILVSALMVSAFTVGVAAQVPEAPVPSAPAPAGTTAAPAPSKVGPAKIGVIAFQVAVSQTNEFQRAFTDLQKKFDPRRQQLHTVSDDIDALTKQLETGGDKMTEQEKAAKARTLDEKKKQFDRQQQDAQADFSQEIQELYAGTASKVIDVLTSYAQQHEYTLVLDIASQQTPVMYAQDSTNITKEIIAAYNVKSGVPPPAPQPAAAPGAQAPKAPGATAKPPAQ